MLGARRCGRLPVGATKAASLCPQSQQQPVAELGPSPSPLALLQLPPSETILPPRASPAPCTRGDPGRGVCPCPRSLPPSPGQWPQGQGALLSELFLVSKPLSQCSFCPCARWQGNVSSLHPCRKPSIGLLSWGQRPLLAPDRRAWRGHCPAETCQSSERWLGPFSEQCVHYLSGTISFPEA